MTSKIVRLHQASVDNGLSQYPPPEDTWHEASSQLCSEPDAVLEASFARIGELPDDVANGVTILLSDLLRETIALRNVEHLEGKGERRKLEVYSRLFDKTFDLWPNEYFSEFKDEMIADFAEGCVDNRRQLDTWATWQIASMVESAIYSWLQAMRKRTHTVAGEAGTRGALTQGHLGLPAFSL